MRSFVFYRILQLLLIGIMFPHLSMADDRHDLARVYFENKQYEEALSLWHEMVQSGNATSGVYYNIGVTESQLGHTPKAMIAFEQALRLKPASKQIRDAIRKEREKIENVIIPVRPFFLGEWSRVLLAIFRPGYWAFFGLLLLISAIALFVYKNLNVSEVKITLQRTNVLLAGGGMIFLLFAFLSFGSLYRGDEAILHIECEMRKAASVESPVMISLHPGEKIRILDKLSDWYYVRLLNLEEGWIKMDCITLIEMGKP